MKQHIPTQWWLLLVGVCLWIVACDDGAGDEQSADTANAIDTSDSTDSELPPLSECPAGVIEDWVCAPQKPQFQDWACPEGWTPTPTLNESSPYVDNFSYCEPPAAPPGLPCPAADWHDEATISGRASGFRGRIWYVKPDAAPGGNGSQTAPFNTISAATNAAAAGEIIALSKGTFVEAVRINEPVALIGACVAETKLAPAPAAELYNVVLIEEVRASLVSDMTISGETHTDETQNIRGVFLKNRNSPAQAAHILQSLHIDRTTLSGIGATETELVLRDVWITHTRNHGINLFYEVQVDAERVVIHDSGLGLFISYVGSELTLRDVQIGHTLDTSVSHQRGLGISVSNGASLTLERVSLLDNRGQGIDSNNAAMEWASTPWMAI